MIKLACERKVLRCHICGDNDGTEDLKVFGFCEDCLAVFFDTIRRREFLIYAIMCQGCFKCKKKNACEWLEKAKDYPPIYGILTRRDQEPRIALAMTLLNEFWEEEAAADGS